MITADVLRDLMSYDKETGVMTWKKGHIAGNEAGCKRKDGYCVIRIFDVLYYRHRLAWLHAYGINPTYTIDHINGVAGDDRLDNLRDVPMATNNENTRKAPKSNTSSGYLGVQKNHGRWQAHITVKGKRYMLGTYDTPIDAHNVYLAAKRKLHAGCTI